jgi:hypothetical protein
MNHNLSLWPSSQPCPAALASLSKRGCPDWWPTLIKLNLIHRPDKHSSHLWRPQNALSALVPIDVGQNRTWHAHICVSFMLSDELKIPKLSSMCKVRKALYRK